MTIDVLSFIFGVYDRLILVQTIVTGYGITDRYSNQVIGRTTEAKQLKCDQDGSDRAVGNANRKRAAIPAAAQMDGERPIRCPMIHPNVAPMQKEGTISPPRKPARMVRAVSTSFQKKSSGRA